MPIVDDIQLVAPAPESVWAGAQTVGARGIQQFFYWIVARFPIGASISQPIFVSNAPNVLNAQNYVRVSWKPVIGASTYDVLRTEAPSFPAQPGNHALAVGVTQTSFDDQGQVLVPYNPAGMPYGAPVACHIYLNNRDYPRPTLEFPCVVRVSTLLFSDGSTQTSAGGGSGTQGPPGPTGPAGPQGATGLTGATGPVGPAGPTGSLGPTGPQGAMGPQGPQGVIGPAGSQGPQGTTGATGIQGVPGPQGPQGSTGPTGPQGPTGAVGPTGPQGPAGTGVTIKGSVPTSADLPATGNTLGDAWITSDTGHLHVWNGSAWDDVGPIQGPAGPAGPEGPIGPQGAPGAAGSTGAQGPQGAPGPTGPAGPAGDIGPAGATGATGPQGPAGAAGPTGNTGPQGPAGATGSAGPQGPTGPAGSQGPPGPTLTATATVLGGVKIGANVTVTADGTISVLPAGTNGQVQFNNSGAFGASANLFWDNANVGLYIGGLTAPIGAAPVAGQAGLTVKGPSTYSICELASGAADAVNALVGAYVFSDVNNTTTVNKRIASVGGLTTGPTVGNRGGSVTLNTRADGGAALTERMRIDHLGNVGINTASPGARLEVVGAEYITADATPIASGAASSQLTIRGQTDTRKALWLSFDTTANVGFIQSGISLVGWNNLVINPAGGSVGIGTTLMIGLLNANAPSFNPTANVAAAFVAQGAYGGGFVLAAGGIASGIWMTSNPTTMNFRADGTATNFGSAYGQLMITSAGNVGIGVPAPSSIAVKFQVGDGANHSMMFLPGATNTIQSMNDNGSAWVPLQINAAAGLYLNPTGGNVGIGGIISPSAQLHVYGTGQATSAPNVNGGAMGGTLVLQDSAGGFNNGGMLVFGFNGGLFAAIKGVAQNGAGNSQGDLLVCTRANTTDTTLTERLRVGSVGVAITGSLTVNGVPITTGGGITTQSDQTGNRALAVVYQNSTGKPMYVMASVASTQICTWDAVTDGSNPPTTIVTKQYGTPTGTTAIGFWVMPGAFYYVSWDNGTGNVQHWLEWY